MLVNTPPLCRSLYTGVVVLSGELPEFEEQVQAANPPPLEILKCSRKR